MLKFKKKNNTIRNIIGKTDKSVKILVMNNNNVYLK